MAATTLLATWQEPGEIALKAAWAARSNGANLLDTVEAGLIATEMDENLIAIGLGSLPNSEGIIELDAAIMEGAELDAGAVCAVTDLVPVISIAKRVMLETPHVMLAGGQARRFGIERGFPPLKLMRDKAEQKYLEWLSSGAQTTQAKDYVHSTADLLAENVQGEHVGDTVTVLGLENPVAGPPHVVAASSTSGLAWKRPGRVGDSPIIGAGIYADDEVGCAGATGWGEELWKAMASFRAIEGMRAGMHPQEACDAVVRQMIRRQPKSLEMSCVVLAMNLKGEFGAALTVGNFTLWICRDGALESKDYVGLAEGSHV